MNPETPLPQILRRLLDKTDEDTKRRKTAVRWFNRLYYEVRSWNQEFIDFLKSYPGISGDRSKAAFEEFFERLGQYIDVLEGKWSPVKKDLCSNLRMLNARFAIDFEWMRSEDKRVYEHIREMVSDAYRTEMGIISEADQLCQDIRMRRKYNRDSLKAQQEIASVIHCYESDSRNAISELNRIAEQSGISLLLITEYEDALNTQGSANPQIMVLGEVMSETYNISSQGGIINVKSQLQNVQQTIAGCGVLADDKKQELASLIAALQKELERVAIQRPKEVKRVTTAVEQVTDEICSDSPDTDWVQSGLATLDKAVRAVKDVAPKALDIASKIAAVVGLLL